MEFQETKGGVVIPKPPPEKPAPPKHDGIIEIQDEDIRKQVEEHLQEVRNLVDQRGCWGDRRIMHEQKRQIDNLAMALLGHADFWEYT